MNVYYELELLKKIQWLIINEIWAIFGQFEQPSKYLEYLNQSEKLSKIDKDCFLLYNNSWNKGNLYHDMGFNDISLEMTNVKQYVQAKLLVGWFAEVMSSVKEKYKLLPTMKGQYLSQPIGYERLND